MANILNNANPFDARSSLDNSYLRLQAMQEMQAQQAPPASTGRFGQLSDFVASIPEDKAAWTSQQTIVQEKVNTMLNVFVNKFLFEQTKTQFEEWCKKNNLPVIDDYVDTFLQVSKGYANPVDTQAKEIAELRQVIAQMQAQKAGDML